MHHFNWLTHFFHQVNETNLHIFTAAIVAVIILLISLAVGTQFKKLAIQLIPSKKFSLTNLLETILEGLYSVFEGIVGHSTKKHFPFLASLFLFILISNFIGMIPGFASPTSNINTNFAIAFCVFFYFNGVGIKEQGLGYLKHFMGPIWWLAPLILAIELFGTLLRPITLSLRLFCNINADHLVLGIFSGLVPLLIPVIFMMLGLFVCFIQAFVFTLLSTIYIGLSSHHGEEHH